MAALFVVPLVTRPNLGPFAGTKDNTKTEQRTAAGGLFIGFAASEGPPGGGL